MTSVDELSFWKHAKVSAPPTFACRLRPTEVLYTANNVEVCTTGSFNWNHLSSVSGCADMPTGHWVN